MVIPLVPPDAVRIAGSQACLNQAFVYGQRVFSLQIHLEITADGINRLIDNCGDDITTGPFVQPPESMRSETDRCAAINRVMDRLLNHLENLRG